MDPHDGTANPGDPERLPQDADADPLSDTRLTEEGAHLHSTVDYLRHGDGRQCALHQRLGQWIALSHPDTTIWQGVETYECTRPHDLWERLRAALAYDEECGEPTCATMEAAQRMLAAHERGEL